MTLSVIIPMGGGWIFNWFIVDFADFIFNPRNRDIGYNNIYNHYASYYRIHSLNQDEFQWHAHPMSTYYEAHRCGTSYLNSPHIIQSLAHRLIDCGNFPNCFRPGFHTERPDSHWLLEQYIPFDFGNQAVDLSEDDYRQKTPANGRFGDWRRAPADWRHYHPKHDDYQVPGNCRRVIFRCLNVGTRLRLITQSEVDKAFKRAHEGHDTILAFCDHDFRDMSLDVEEAYRLITASAQKYNDVRWKNSRASEAARNVLGLSHEPVSIAASFDPDDPNRLTIEASIDSFGSQPFFAVKTKSGRYIHDNLDVQIPNRKWTYTFDHDSIHKEDVAKIGIAVNSKTGSGNLIVADEKGNALISKSW